MPTVTIAATRLRVTNIMISRIRLGAAIPAISGSYQRRPECRPFGRRGTGQVDIRAGKRRALSASRTDWSIASICEIPSAVAGSPSWVMIIRAA